MSRHVSSPVVVGRRDQFALLECAVSAAGRGEPSITLVCGEAGIGKSRLVRDAERTARGRGVLALHGECIQLTEGEFPFAPIVAALHEAGADALEAAIAQLPA